MTIRNPVWSSAVALAAVLGSLPAQVAAWEPVPMIGVHDWYGMGHDPARDRVVVFGGSHCGAWPRSDTWEWTGSRWSRRRPPATPMPIRREQGELAFDWANGSLMLFGGYVQDLWANNAFDDQWLWDGQTWTELHPTVRPAARVAFAMAADPVRRRVVLFGGSPLALPRNDTWEWDGTNWQQMFPATSPGGRAYAAMAYCARNGRMVLVGGSTGVGLWRDVTWEWDGQNWIRFQGPEPESRVASLCEMPWNGKVLLHGWTALLPTPLGLSSERVNDTWEWDGSAWTRIATPNRPRARENVRMAPSLALQEVVLYGGRFTGPPAQGPSTDPLDDEGSTWVYANGDWMRRVGTELPPVTNAFILLEENPSRDRLLFLNTDFSAQGGHETWVFEGGQFRRLPVPLLRDLYNVGGYHAGLDLTVVECAQTLIAPWSYSTWVWDGTTWTRDPVPVTTTNGIGLVTTYDPDRRALVTMGGSNRIREWRGLGQGWVERVEARLPFPPATVGGTALCYDPVRHRLVYAGPGTGAPLDVQTWEFDDEDGIGWRQIVPQHVPPSPGRTSTVYVPELGGILMTATYLRTVPSPPEHWLWDGVDWTQVAVEQTLSWAGANRPYTVIHDPLHGRLRTMRPRICDGVAPSESMVWNLEFKTLRPSTHHPRIGELLTFSIEHQAQANRFFAVLLSGGDYPGIRLPGTTRILPLRDDPLLRASFIPNLYGVLDAQGRGSAFLQFPNHPALVGLSLHSAMVTLSPTGAIGAVSNPVPIDVNP